MARLGSAVPVVVNSEIKPVNSAMLVYDTQDGNLFVGSKPNRCKKGNLHNWLSGPWMNSRNSVVA